MSRIGNGIFQIAAAAAVVAISMVAPASAVEVSAGADETVAAGVAVASTEIRDAALAQSFAAVPFPQRRPKVFRTVSAPVSRPVAVAHQYRDCSGSWCGRQFVLMIGVGY